jgi:hypothetical protein
LGAAGAAGAAEPFAAAGAAEPFAGAAPVGKVPENGTPLKLPAQLAPGVGAAEPLVGEAPPGKVPEKDCPLILPPKLPENPGGSWIEPGVFGTAEANTTQGLVFDREFLGLHTWSLRARQSQGSRGSQNGEK